MKSRCTRSPALGAAASPASLTEGGAGGSGASVHLGVTWEWAGGGGNHRPDYKTTPPRLRAGASRAVRSIPLRAGLLTASPAGKPRPSQPREPGRRLPRSERGRAGAEAGRRPGRGRRACAGRGWAASGGTGKRGGAEAGGGGRRKSEGPWRGSRRLAARAGALKPPPPGPALTLDGPRLQTPRPGQRITYLFADGIAPARPSD